ncbi:hypothetical protein EDC61_11492 [Sulfuritortus calidifontis]|uniref:Uncharacterized protein n=1 Tax=Sulfuritortus calidifontis TaxID=1914471 RepID=A0A4R3JTP5_9PROT|nr:hypothetical protein [Sulfuritortus calidifontis]TCS70765.1 hypothetical protein EDC61_11492 [Sulfuritortus calidifontis]
MRQALEAAIRARIEAVAPALICDLWGRQQVTLLITRLAISATSRAAEGEAQAVLMAETPDAFPVDAMLEALRDPIFVSGATFRLRARLTSLAERIEDMAAVCRLTFTIEVMQ